VRILLPEDEQLDSPVVICTGSRFNEGQSITNAAERIAAEVIHGHRLPTPLVWIEHYEEGAGQRPEDSASFDLVTSASYEVENLGSYMGEERRRIGSPSWWRLDRASVEALVGQPL
jgi:uncharacterized SAM-binding protein YcdF (DUF218 family)